MKVNASVAATTGTLLAIDFRQVHVWHADLRKRPPLVSELVGWLSPIEQARAETYRFETDAAAYVVSHAMLRWLLARYIGKSHPQDVILHTGRHGRPRLVLAQALKGHRFSLSRSHSLAVVAITRFGRVGIDVERSAGADDTAIRDGGEMSMREWVRREAAIKALGGTLDDIHRYEVGGESPVSVRAHTFARLVDVHDLFARPTYELAVAVPPGWRAVLAGEWRLDHVMTTDRLLESDAEPAK